ncbi:hypothetical protein ACFWUZ_31465 [Streptomyces sp. NPDC058646]|uniref:hypothetical protein n=1 Tax=Streptomyces sp. NPDC058646 TaxID=3346574 RepID=UPI00365B25F5
MISLRNRRPGLLADRWARNRFEPAEFGLVPREQLDPRRGGPETDPGVRAEQLRVADAAFEGDWRPAAAHVRAARPGDWDDRWSRLELLLQLAESDDRWLTDWRTAEPSDGDAATVDAQQLLRRAWAVRGSAYAKDVPDGDMRQFMATLPAVMAAAQRASELAPADPGPWVVMVTAARAMGYSRGQFGDLWRNLTKRAPHHTAAHWQALQYWCAKWGGSDELMLDFARRAALGAPAGSTLPGIYLHALAELRTKWPAADPQLLLTVAERLDAVREDHEGLPRLRHLLAHHLLRSGQPAAALEQFRRIGPYCGAAPWNTDPAGPVAAFDLARGLAAHGARR